jgi:alpha-ketoglutarate-dependent taurine dioxygenase
LITKVSYGAFSSWQKLVDAVILGIRESGVILIGGLPYDPPIDALKQLASSVGKLSLTDVTVPEEADAQIHAVESKEQPLRDGRGLLIISTSNSAFPYHTDDYFDKHPSDVVFLHCVRQADVGGDSLVAMLPDIIEHLDDESIGFLLHPIFPAPFGLVAILERNANKIHIRYNRNEIEQSARSMQIQLTAQHLAVMEKLEEAINAATQTLRIIPGECLVLNNRTVVHGRTEFPAESGRLFRRVKVYL